MPEELTATRGVDTKPNWTNYPWPGHAVRLYMGTRTNACIGCLGGDGLKCRHYGAFGRWL